ncbi:alpha/beta-hydrolase [Mollisia scopiformis]|uniref:Carboxylic ester hydrolase n=1 Tax=Mollisia scopiformis TaxID=149040 RepID=A0A194XEP3_MOLSC|nr:alpha/beta-hydrolase [Mollisia scopiformis]KUJ18614.1 alpha/beta-hydrolase [Mollisia scopiformis]
MAKVFITWALFASLGLATTQVDLGYSIYQGVKNSTTGLTTFLGVRYAAPPIGSLRWQAPQSPAVNRTVMSASSFGPICPNSPLSLGPFGSVGAIASTEDCLFLNVYAPSNAKNLPVLVYIHGGGYGAGNGQQDLSSIINGNGNSFIGVAIQYRLGAFGFLSSAEVKRKGVLNAGILDQHFSLEWVQKYIACFGGDPNRVTISGESAGAGSVMLHDIAYGGTLGTSLFINSITASPYTPEQYEYSDPVPTALYDKFAIAAGCPTGPTSFECLVAQNSTTLQEASFNGFTPMTDGTYIQQRPSQALLQKKVNGLKQLSGNNANEGNLFVISGITTESDLVAYVNETFFMLTSTEQNTLLNYYSFIADPQEAAYEIYGDATLVCPSYWLAEAYSAKDSLKGYKYQYSVPVALHGTDTAAYFGPPTVNQGPDFVKAFQTIWGNFVTKNDPSISNSIANGAASPSPHAPNPASHWPPYSRAAPEFINLNETGGTLANVTSPFGTIVLEYIEPGLKNNITLLNAYTFENDRGVRCDYWRSISANVPE